MKNMKKIIALCMVLCLVLSTAACGQSVPATDAGAEKAAEPADGTEGAEGGAGQKAGAADKKPGAEPADGAEGAEGGVGQEAGAADKEPGAEPADGAEGAEAAAGQEAGAADKETGAESAAGTAGTEEAAELAAGEAGTEKAAAGQAAGTAGTDTAAEAADPGIVNYANEENWAYFGIGEDKDADLFLICPTVDMRDEYNMSMDDEETKASFTGALNMERGIYEDSTRMYAPYYRQASMKIFDLTEEDREPYLTFAYSDISAAFAWYLENENEGRPIILAGFSQGADMCLRLLEEYFGDESLYNQLVAVYAVGWSCTEEMVQKYPQIVPAQSADDIGTVICFDCEAPEVTETVVIPAGIRSYSINPLNWKTDGTVADKSENIGACFTSYSGEIKREEINLCGCYIDEERGVLKVTDVTPADFPPVLSILPEGSYHLYDYQFFYRNLQENVANRVKIYLESLLDDAA